MGFRDSNDDPISSLEVDFLISILDRDVKSDYARQTCKRKFDEENFPPTYTSISIQLTDDDGGNTHTLSDVAHEKRIGLGRLDFAKLDYGLSLSIVLTVKVKLGEKCDLLSQLRYWKPSPVSTFRASQRIASYISCHGNHNSNGIPSELIRMNISAL